MKNTFEQSAQRFSAFILERFADASALDHFNKLKEEVKEVEDELTALEGFRSKDRFKALLAVELADCIGCLLGIGVKAGIPVTDTIDAFIEKTEVNINRKWARNPDGTYSHTPTP